MGSDEDEDGDKRRETTDGTLTFARCICIVEYPIFPSCDSVVATCVHSMGRIHYKRCHGTNTPPLIFPCVFHTQQAPQWSPSARLFHSEYLHYFVFLYSFFFDLFFSFSFLVFYSCFFFCFSGNAHLLVIQSQQKLWAKSFALVFAQLSFLSAVCGDEQ